MNLVSESLVNLNEATREDLKKVKWPCWKHVAFSVKKQRSEVNKLALIYSIRLLFIKFTIKGSVFSLCGSKLNRTGFSLVFGPNSAPPAI